MTSAHSVAHESSAALVARPGPRRGCLFPGAIHRARSPALHAWQLRAHHRTSSTKVLHHPLW